MMQSKFLFDDEDEGILKKAIENELRLSNYNKKSLKLFVFYLFLFLVNRRQQLSNKIYIINGKAQLKYAKYEDFQTVYYGVFSKKIRAYINSKTIVSMLSLYDRIQIVLKSIDIGRKRGISKGYVIDYLLWKNIISSVDFNTICNNGHYDRVTTQIAMLVEKYKKKYIMKQHGLLGNDIVVPNKFSVNQIIAFDENEVDKFRRNVLTECNCEFQINYISPINFVSTTKKGFRVGVIDVPLDIMKEIYDVVYSTFTNEEVVVMLHPLCREKYEDRDNMKFIKDYKEWNCDIIISGPSTLAYDYLKNGFNNLMVIYDSLEVFSGKEKIFKNAVIYDDINLLKKDLSSRILLRKLNYE